jgi:peptide/nickel transport system substrate-binding protein
MTRKSSDRIERRRLLQALGAAGAAGLAGCGSNNQNGDGNGGDSNDLGERVPAMTLTYWGDYGGTTTEMENAVPIIERNWEERLDLNVDVQPKGLTQSIGDLYSDARNTQVGFWAHSSLPTRFDPQYMLGKFTVGKAGANGRDNPAQYANCEVTELVQRQSAATDSEERNQIVQQIESRMSQDYPVIPIVPRHTFGLARTNTVDVQNVGSYGVIRFNVEMMVNSSPVDKDAIVMQTPVGWINNRNFPTVTTYFLWSNYVHSPLLQFDRNLELRTTLANDYFVENDGKRVTFDLMDATFHNGDAVTSEDVKFSFEQMRMGGQEGHYPTMYVSPFDSIETPDDSTVEFNFTKPFLPFLLRVAVNVPIVHKQTWVEGGARENPQDFDFDPMIGSGPWQVDEFESGSFLSLEPHDGHPSQDPDHDIIFRAYRDSQTAFQALLNEEIDMMDFVPSGLYNRAQDQMGDTIRATPGPAAYRFMLYPQNSYGPTKFQAFRQALGASLNRQEMSQVAWYGYVDPVMDASPVNDDLPWKAQMEDLAMFTDQPTGDEDAARQVLLNAGWGWDDSGNLRYPADADLSPLWPEGETPSSEDFPCLEQNS